jgi:hypothetical protein
MITLPRIFDTKDSRFETTHTPPLYILATRLGVLVIIIINILMPVKQNSVTHIRVLLVLADRCIFAQYLLDDIFCSNQTVVGFVLLWSSRWFALQDQEQVCRLPTDMLPPAQHNCPTSSSSHNCATHEILARSTRTTCTRAQPTLREAHDIR